MLDTEQIQTLADLAYVVQACPARKALDDPDVQILVGRALDTGVSFRQVSVVVGCDAATLLRRGYVSRCQWRTAS